MPRPKYIICSQDRLIDQSTGLLTHIKVVESFKFQQVDGDVPDAVVGTFIMTSVWMREDDDDPNAEYEFEIVLNRTDGSSETTQSGQFKFTRRFFRIEMGVGFSPRKIPSPGIMSVATRIRKTGEEKWLSQSFPMEIEVSEPPDVQAAKVIEESDLSDD